MTASMVGTYFETWHVFQCPKCNALNWVCNGSEEDLTIEDSYSARCFKCECCFWLCDTLMAENGDPEDYAVNGQNIIIRNAEDF